MLRGGRKQRDKQDRTDVWWKQKGIQQLILPASLDLQVLLRTGLTAKAQLLSQLLSLGQRRDQTWQQSFLFWFYFLKHTEDSLTFRTVNVEKSAL